MPLKSFATLQDRSISPFKSERGALVLQHASWLIFRGHGIQTRQRFFLKALQVLIKDFGQRDNDSSAKFANVFVLPSFPEIPDRQALNMHLQKGIIDPPHHVIKFFPTQTPCFKIIIITSHHNIDPSKCNIVGWLSRGCGCIGFGNLLRLNIRLLTISTSRHAGNVTGNDLSLVSSNLVVLLSGVSLGLV